MRLNHCTTGGVGGIPGPGCVILYTADKRKDDESFHVRNCHQIQASSYFIDVLQTIRDLAKNAKNHFMLQNPHLAVVMVSS